MCDNCGACETCDLKRSHKTINILAADAGKPDMAAKYKLTYFPIMGLAEPVRLLLSYANIEFEDDRFEVENWPKLKPDQPFGQVPVLEVDGKKAHQSMALARYVGKLAKLTGKDEWEDLQIDAIADTFNDFRQKIGQYYYEKEPAAKEDKKKVLFDETLPHYLERLEAVAKENDGHLACGRLTWADFLLAGLYELMCHYTDKDLWEGHPNLIAVNNNVRSLPAVKAWIEKRPKTDY